MTRTLRLHVIGRHTHDVQESDIHGDYLSGVGNHFADEERKIDRQHLDGLARNGQRFVRGCFEAMDGVMFAHGWTSSLALRGLVVVVMSVSPAHLAWHFFSFFLQNS